jgi:predicted ABC-type ATPase
MFDLLISPFTGDLSKIPSFVDTLQLPSSAPLKKRIYAPPLGERLLRQGVSFCFETVFSHVSKVDFVAHAKAQGYEIILVYIHLVNSELNEARVYQRVTEGGHSVPVDKILSRIPRTMKHIGIILPLVDEARLLDNSVRDNPFHQVACVKQGERQRTNDPLPKWTEEILRDIT